jgi:predicted 3-demethylubiquinone-9 3-methyltransferase (glyoxalase superfamily)
MPLPHPITPHLWFDTQAKEAAAFYCSIFPEAGIDHSSQIHDTPSGDCDIVSFHLAGQPFMAISAGPYFTFNPSISFFVNFDPSRDPQAREHLDALWAALSEGGTALMPLSAYPFSPRYGWVRDKYGVSWQLILTNPEGEPRPVIVPSFLFNGPATGKAEEALRFYASVFDDSAVGNIVHYPAGMAPDKEGSLMFGEAKINGQWFAAMDSAHAHDAPFNESVSFILRCRDQAEIDRYWAKLSTVPEAEQCGWCKDAYGVSWQITPAVMDEMMRSNDQARVNRVTQAFLKMKKFDLAALEAAYEG